MSSKRAERPKSVTVVSWIFIGMGLIELNRVIVGPLLFAQFGEYYSRLRSERPIEYALLYIGPLIEIMSGAFVLFGHNWARWLLGMLIGFVAVANAWNANFKRAVVDLVWLVIAGYYLFRPGANAFFKGPFEAAAPQGGKLTAQPVAEQMAASGAVGDKGEGPEPPPPLG